MTDVFDKLKNDLSGTIVLPGDLGWDSARATWDLVVDQPPAASGSHRRRSTARAGAGAAWSDVAAPAAELGLVPLAGTAPDVSVAGYTLGGGLSLLARQHGLACNNVTAVEVVTADGQLRRVDHEHDEELFWALRGGGGNFGVVTALEFELFPVPELYGGMLAWPWEQGHEVLGAWSDWLTTLPDAVTSIARLMRVPPLPELPGALRGRDLVTITAAMLCPETTGALLLAELRRLEPESPLPHLVDTPMLDPLPAADLDALVDTVGPAAESPLVVVELRTSAAPSKVP